MQNEQTPMDFMRRAGVRRVVGGLLISTQLLVNASVFADAMSDVGRSAQSDGKAWQKNAPLPSANGNTLNLGNGESLNMQDLYPGTSQEGNWFPDGEKTNIDGLKDVFESASGMEQVGGARKAKLWKDAQSDDPSIEGAAYKVLLDAAASTQHEQAFENDPSFQTTKEIFANAQEFADSFGDCSVVYTPRETTRTVHMPDPQVCERIQKPQVDCDITHQINLGTYEGNRTFYLSSASGTSDFEIDLKTGAWQIRWSRGHLPFPGDRRTVYLEAPDRWTSATVTEVIYDSLAYPIRYGYQWLHYNSAGGGESNQYEYWYLNAVNLNGQWVDLYRRWSKKSSEFVKKDGIHIYDQDAVFFGANANFIAHSPITTNQWSYKIISGVSPIDYDELCSTENNQINIEKIWRSFGTAGEVNWHVYQAPSCKNGLVMKIRVKNTRRLRDDHKIPYTAGVSLNFHGTSVKSDSWHPQACIDAARQLDGSGFCKADYTVLQGATNESSCITVQGIKICPGSSMYNKLTPSPLPGIPRLAQKVNVGNVRCGAERENICFWDEDGNYVCTDEMGYDTQGCKELEENPQCAFVNSECDPDSMIAGTCTIFEDTYDCGYSVDVSTVVMDETIQCAGEIRCMGTDCLDVNKEDSMSDMAHAIALLQAAESMASDSSCTPTGSEGAMSCRIFPGKEYKCKKPAGIAKGGSAFLTNCCKKPEQGQKPSLSQFVQAVILVPAVQGAIGALGGPAALAPLQGTWQTLKGGASKTFNGVTNPFTSWAENASGHTESDGTSQEQLANDTSQGLKEKTKSMLTEALGGGDSASSQSSQIMGAGGQALSMLNNAMVGMQVAKLIIGLIWHCDKRDIELDVQKKLKNCVHIGTYCSQKIPLIGCVKRKESYCCFNSPLSRIMQQEIRKQPQMGLSWGRPKSPDCRAISTDMLEKVNWDQVNLDEWIAILHATGQMPNGSNVTMNALTGTGSFMDTNGARMNVEERTKKRFEGIDGDAARREAADTMVLDTGAP